MSAATRLGTTLAMTASAGAFAASCALVGYDLDGYHPAGEGGGGSATHSSSNAVGGATSTSTATAGGAGNPAGGGGSSNTGGSGGAGPQCPLGSMCYEPPPAGFKGPYVYSITDVPGSCSGTYGEFVLQGGSENTSPPISCTNCSCGFEPCQPAVTGFYSDPACATQAGGANVPADNSCHQLASALSASSVEVFAIQTKSAVSCTPVGGTLLAAPPGAFTNSVTVCTGTVSGSPCSDGTGQCLPLPDPAFDQTVCIESAAPATCPNGYPNELKVSETLVDDRKCKACACSSPAPSCPSSTNLYGDATCNTFILTASGGSGCIATPGDSFDGVRSVVTGSPCTPGGGQPSGNVVGSQNVVLCCR